MNKPKKELVIKPAKVFPPTELEPPNTTSVYSGKPLSLEDTERAVLAEAGKHR